MAAAFSCCWYRVLHMVLAMLANAGVLARLPVVLSNTAALSALRDFKMNLQLTYSG